MRDLIPIPLNPIIIFSLMQELYFEQSINLAHWFRISSGNGPEKGQGMSSSRDCLYLHRLPCRVYLIETGFITNPEEEKYLMSEEGQDYIFGNFQGIQGL